MAYAALVSLAQTTDLILNQNKYSISVDASETIISIREHVIFLTSFLDDFPEKVNRRLEGKIRDAANEAEDIIEYFMWKQIGVSWWTVGLSRAEFEHQLQKVTEEIGLLVGELMDDRPGDLPAAISSSRYASTGKNDVAIGLDEDLMAIKHRLCGESSKLQVIPIVGTGGIGKTTLARTAYNDLLIMNCFEIRAWVQVSQDYCVKKFLSSLLESMRLLGELKSGQENEIDVMAKIVYKSLKGRKYLIVMDDVWSTNVWDDVRNIFPNDNNGSRIMLTTKLSNVATYPDPDSPLYEMKFLDENQSWNLLKQKVFSNKNIDQDCPPELEEVGKDIARGCGGLPLALVLVAGILSSIDKTRASWEKIVENVNSIVDWELEKILSLSYMHLPHHLRPYFLYIGGFPKDHIPVTRLIKLWIAEGFLNHQNGSKSLEEQAQGYLEDLVKRRLVLVTSRKRNGEIKNCSLHDLVREWCIRQAQEEMFLLHVKNKYDLPKGTKNERRLCITYSHLENIWGPTTRTILCLQLLDNSSMSLLGNFRLLRVLLLDVLKRDLKQLPPQLFELFQLRYLALGKYIEIPTAISNLQNLQTLIIGPKIRSDKNIRISPYLPLEIWRMPQLRHLVFADYYILLDPADGTSLPLENLQTLSVVGSLMCSERFLRMIPNVKNLGITYYNNHEHHLHNLMYLHQLEKLKVIASWEFSWQQKNPAFPTTLKKLTLVGGGLPWREMAIRVGSLPKLEVLKLIDYACHGCTWETIEGGFLELKFLLIEKSNLQHWIAESSHFPRLECLLLHHCERLNGIPNGIGEIPTLELIEVDCQNKSLVESTKQILEGQLSYRNDALQVRCIDHYQPWTIRKKDKW